MRIAPILEYTRGYLRTTSARSPRPGQSYGGKFYNIPQVNFGGGVTQIPGFLGVTGPGLSTNFCDPVFCGNAFHPNIAAGRGTCETPSAGGCLSHPGLGADLTMEFTHNKNTVGIYMQNVFNNMYYGAIPVVNPYYQPNPRAASRACRPRRSCRRPTPGYAGRDLPEPAGTRTFRPRVRLRAVHPGAAATVHLHRLLPAGALT